MNITGVSHGYRKFGINYGLPVYYIDIGIGESLKAEAVLYRVGQLGIQPNRWITIRNNPLGQSGLVVLIQGAKAVRCRVEIEEDGTKPDPVWYSDVDRWIVKYIKNPKFNYGALRPRQDIIYCGDDEIEELLALKTMGLRAVLTNNIEAIWDKVKDKDIRVYLRED